MQKTISLKLTETEAVDLSGLIDIAVKSAGIKVAVSAGGIHQKLFDACEPFRGATPSLDEEE
jgi:predicted DNA-binding protein (UPF0251 family)